MVINIRIKSFLIFSLALLLAGSPIYAQQSNPFELNHRLKKVKIDSTDREDRISFDSVLLTQPDSLDLDSPNVKSLQQEDTSQNKSNSQEEDKIQERPVPIGDASAKEIKIPKEDSAIGGLDEKVEVPMPEVLQSKRNLIFGTFIILTLFLTVVISFNRQVVNHIIRSILNDNFMNMLHRDQKGRWSMQFVFLYIFFIANISLFIFLMVDQWQFDKFKANLLILSLIIGGIYFIKHSTLSFLGNTFNIERETGQFSFTIMLFNIFLGLLLLPINLFIAFAPYDISNFFIYTALIVIGLTFILRQLRGLFIANRFLLNHQFHFLLYLCTVEIAPILVLIKFFQPYFN